MAVSSQLIRLAGYVFSALKKIGLFQDPISKGAFERLYEKYKLAFELKGVVRTLKFIDPGSAVIDVGANVGILTVQFAKSVGPQGRVIAIEPAPENLASLRDRLAVAKLSNRVQVFAGVASNKVGHERLVLKPLEPWDHHIGPDGVLVDATTIDALVDELQPPRVSYVKIDVQGAEQLVLDGMHRTLREQRPAICIEIDPTSLARYDTGVEKIVDVLAGFDYGMYNLSKAAPVSISLKEIKEILLVHTYVDVLFLHRDAARRDQR